MAPMNYVPESVVEALIRCWENGSDMGMISEEDALLIDDWLTEEPTDRGLSVSLVGLLFVACLISAFVAGVVIGVTIAL